MSHKVKSVTIIFLITVIIILLSIAGVILEQGTKVRL